MKSQPLMIRIGLALYLVMFFTYLLGPLILMSVTAFNSASFPQITPWEIFSFEWFAKLFADDRILTGLKHSLYVGFFVVILSVSMGLAGALVLTQVWPKLRATYYTILIAPILVPGVVIGISTLVFWARINSMLGFSPDSYLANGIFLTVLGQSTFIASYCMLVFVARLQRYDTGLTEAALDLGATHLQAFRKIQLPFLYPAMASSAVLAFLASFENYNTSIFTHQKFATLTIVLSQKVRYGIDPSISALAFIIICLTVFFALLNEVRTRRVQLAEANGAPVGVVTGGFKMPKFFSGNPAAVVFVLFVIGAVATVAIAQLYDPEPAKAVLLKEKRAAQKLRIEALQERMKQKRLQKKMKGPDIFKPDEKDSSVFTPRNLKDASGSGKKTTPAKKKPASPFGGVFAPGNLDEVGGVKKPAAKPGNPFGNVFAPNNLEKTGPKE